MIRWPAVVLLLLLTACGGGGNQVIIENPYAEKMKELSRNGVAAMQKERWEIAESSFDRALQAAQLANDPVLIARAWYNLGMLHVASGELMRGEAALKRAQSVAIQHGLTVSQLRSRIALALLYQKRGDEAWQPEALPSTMPVDLHLSAARLAQLQGRYGVARQEYDFVLSKAGDARPGLLYKADAHMGLALMAEQQQDHETASREAESVLQISRKIGAPRQAAHALFLKATLTQNVAEKRDSLQDALAIYRALKDLHGQSDTLHQLMHLAEHEGNGAELERLQGELEQTGEAMMRAQGTEQRD
ncbi:MAG: hypothetical protein RQ867_07860 [Mariprofundaceae bacterium]|nr:hypothetical protein [Mariprofundaceae bacterium]